MSEFIASRERFVPSQILKDVITLELERAFCEDGPQLDSGIFTEVSDEDRQLWSYHDASYRMVRVGVAAEERAVELLRLKTLEDGIVECRLYMYHYETGDLFVVNNYFSEDETKNFSDHKDRATQGVQEGMHLGLYDGSDEKDYADFRDDICTFQQSRGL